MKRLLLVAILSSTLVLAAAVPALAAGRVAGGPRPDLHWIGLSQGSNSSDPDWKYVNVRRLYIYLEHSIDSGTQWAVFEPNGDRHR